MGFSFFRHKPRVVTLSGELRRLEGQARGSRDASGAPFSRSLLARESGVSESTLAAWLDQGRTPQDSGKLLDVVGVLAGWAGQDPASGPQWLELWGAARRDSAARTGGAGAKPKEDKGWVRRASVWGTTTAVAALLGGLFAAFGGDLHNLVLSGGAPSSSTPAGSALKITPSWPVQEGCDGATEVAVFSGGPAPGAVRTSAATDVRTTLTQAGAAAFGYGTLTLTFTVTGSGTAQINSIVPIFYKKQARQPAWVYTPQGGCGDTYARVFDLNLDRRAMRDLGVQGNPAMLPAGSPKPIAGQAGKSFHVSSSDPATLAVSAHACSQQYFEWGLKITYILDGQQHVEQVGSEAAPYRLIGTLPQAAAAYATNMNTGSGPLVPALTATARHSPGCALANGA